MSTHTVIDIADPPRTRSSDPATSHTAEARMRQRGDDLRDHAIIERVLRNSGTLTACEIAALSVTYETSVERHNVSRRLPEMERSGRVVRCLPRPCTVRGTTQTTWSLSKRAIREAYT